jgi:hypothetical protein
VPIVEKTRLSRQITVGRTQVIDCPKTGHSRGIFRGTQ